MAEILGMDGEPLNRNGKPRIVGPDGIPADPISPEDYAKEELEMLSMMFEMYLQKYPTLVWGHPAVAYYYANYVAHAALCGTDVADTSAGTFSVRVSSDDYKKVASEYSCSITGDGSEISFNFKRNSVTIGEGDDQR